MTKVYRFNRAAADTSSTDRLVLLKKRKKRPPVDYRPVASDKTTFTDADGTWPIDTYREHSSGSDVTMTKMEADLIALSNPGISPPMALEVSHPWLPRKPFLDDSKASYQMVMSVLRKHGRHLFAAGDFCDEKWNTICNAVRRKSALDGRYYIAWHTPIQEAYVLEERRPDHSVIAIDFNLMYPTCMQQIFPKPSSLRRVVFDRAPKHGEDLPTGLYRCRLDQPCTDFIRMHNPFRSFVYGRRLRASLSEPVEVDLNEFEVAYYLRHFERVHIVDAVISDQTIPHPLAREARRNWARRMNFRVQGNKALADREKFFATLMSSCASRPVRTRSFFRGRHDAFEHLQATYGISPAADEPEAFVESWMRRNRAMDLGPSSGELRLEAPHLSSGTACFLFGQRIVAKARIVLLETMERVLSLVDGVSICYANIDSIHLSIPTKYLREALSSLESEASEEMGSFKIEAVTRHGLWLEPGRYWLYGDAIEKFKNRSIGNGKNPFKDRAVHVASRRIDGLHIPFRLSFCMATTMSGGRSITKDANIFRQDLIEAGGSMDFDKILDSLTENRIRSDPMRLEAFEDLKRRLGYPCHAASRQG